MKKIIIFLMLTLMYSQACIAAASDAELFDDIEALLQESDTEVQQRETIEQQAKADRERKYRNLINNFIFPQDNCSRPKLYVPTTNDGFKQLAGTLNTWQRCESRMEDADYNSLRQLILDLDGEWDEHDQRVYWGLNGNEIVSENQINFLWDKLSRRSEGRAKGMDILHDFFTEQADKFHAEIEQYNQEVDRQNRRNFWLDALSGMEQGLREYNQRYNQQY